MIELRYGFWKFSFFTRYNSWNFGSSKYYDPVVKINHWKIKQEITMGCTCKFHAVSTSNFEDLIF